MDALSLLYEQMIQQSIINTGQTREEIISNMNKFGGSGGFSVTQTERKG
jgi:hypothetical protein